MLQSQPKEERIIGLRDRLRKAVAERSNAEVADHAGISRQALGNYINGGRLPDAENIIKLCKGLEVSADWLLGLSPTRSPKIDIQSTVATTGLTEEAVNNLAQIWHISMNDNILVALSMICAADPELLDSMAECVHQAINAKQMGCDRPRSISERLHSMTDPEVLKAKKLLSQHGYVSMTTDQVIQANIDAALSDMRAILTRAIYGVANTDESDDEYDYHHKEQEF